MTAAQNAVTIQTKHFVELSSVPPGDLSAQTPKNALKSPTSVTKRLTARMARTKGTATTGPVAAPSGNVPITTDVYPIRIYVMVTSIVQITVTRQVVLVQVINSDALTLIAYRLVISVTEIMTVEIIVTNSTAQRLQVTYVGTN